VNRLSQQIFQRPSRLSNSLWHCWRTPQSFVHPAQVIISKVQSEVNVCPDAKGRHRPRLSSGRMPHAHVIFSYRNQHDVHYHDAADKQSGRGFVSENEALSEGNLGLVASPHVGNRAGL
jgi:hypothetical protein